MPALLKALQHAAEAAQKTALRQTGCDWWGRRCGVFARMTTPTVNLLAAADIGQDATDPIIVAEPHDLARGAAENTDGHQPPGSAPLLADKPGNTRSRIRARSSALIGAQFCHSLNW